MNHYSPKIITTLLIGYTPIQNKKLQKKKKKKDHQPRSDVALHGVKDSGFFFVIVLPS